MREGASRKALLCRGAPRRRPRLLGVRLTPPGARARRPLASRPAGQVLSFPGEGMPKFNGGRGNLYVRIQIEFPSSLSNLTDAQRQLLRQLLS